MFKFALDFKSHHFTKHLVTEKAQYTTPSVAAPDTEASQPTNTAETQIKSNDSKGLRNYNIWATVALVLVIIAWVLMMYQGYVALAVAVPAVVAGFFGYKSRIAILRYLSAVSIIAGLVLIVVMLAFITVFSIVIETI
jgi:hypothetical protein